MFAGLDIPAIVSEWDRASSMYFSGRHVELNSRFTVKTTDEVTLDRPEVGTGFGVICGFCRLRLPVHHEVLC